MHQWTCWLFPNKLYLPSLESLAPESTKDSLASEEDLRGDRSWPRSVFELSFVLGFFFRLVFESCIRIVKRRLALSVYCTEYSEQKV